jgi:predicted aconitase
LDSLSFDFIGDVEVSWLERYFEEGEVMEVVKALNGDKASGHGGYSMAFFQACWVVSKENIMKVFHDLHARGKFERGAKCYVYCPHSEDYNGC